MITYLVWYNTLEDEGLPLIFLHQLDRCAAPSAWAPPGSGESAVWPSAQRFAVPSSRGNAFDADKVERRSLAMDSMVSVLAVAVPSGRQGYDLLACDFLCGSPDPPPRRIGVGTGRRRMDSPYGSQGLGRRQWAFSERFCDLSSGGTVKR